MVGFCVDGHICANKKQVETAHGTRKLVNKKVKKAQRLKKINSAKVKRPNGPMQKLIRPKGPLLIGNFKKTRE